MEKDTRNSHSTLRRRKILKKKLYSEDVSSNEANSLEDLKLLPSEGFITLPKIHNSSYNSASIDIKPLSFAHNVKLISRKSNEIKLKLKKTKLPTICVQDDYLPLSPDSQRRIILEEIKNELSTDSFALKEETTTLKHVSVKVPSNLWNAIKLRVNSSEETDAPCEDDILDLSNAYKKYAERAECMLHLLKNQNRYNEVLEYRKCIVIKAPVPWHESYRISKERLLHRLFTFHPLITYLRILWRNKYMDLKIFVVDKWPNRSESLGIRELEKIFDESNENFMCSIQEWLKDCQDCYFKYERDLKKEFNSFHSNKKEKLLNSVQVFASSMIRIMIVNYISHFVQIFENNMYDQHNFLVKLTLRIEDKDNVEIFPNVDLLSNFFEDHIERITKHCKNIYSIESILDQSNKKFSKNLFPVNIEEDFVQDAKKRFNIIITENFAKCTSIQIKVYHSYKEILNTCNSDIRIAVVNDSSFSVKSQMHTILTKLRNEIQSFKQPPYVKVGLFKINSETIQNEIRCLLEEYIQQLADNIITITIFQSKELLSKYQLILKMLSKSTKTTNEVVTMIKYVNELLKEGLDKMQKKKNKLFCEIFFVLTKFKVERSDLELFATLHKAPKMVKYSVEKCYDELLNIRDSLETNINLMVENLGNDLSELKEEIDLFSQLNDVGNENVYRNCNMLKDLCRRCEEKRKMIENINLDEKLLNWVSTNFKILDTIKSDLHLYQSLWNGVQFFFSRKNSWMNDPVMTLNADAIAFEIEEMEILFENLTIQFFELPKPQEVGRYMKEYLDDFKKYLPVLNAVCNTGLKERHWNMILMELHIDSISIKDINLSILITYDLFPKLVKIEEISCVATKELQIENALYKIKFEWTDMNFQFLKHSLQKVHTLTRIDEIQGLLDEHLLKTHSLRASPYIRPFEDECKNWETLLINLQDIIDGLIKVQTTWAYLNPIFDSNEIVKQMPEESKVFSQINCQLRNIIKKLYNQPKILSVLEFDNFFASIMDIYSSMEVITKGLHFYLEQKRLKFPRFFFLSNDELIDLLSETKITEKVQPHLKKCFEGIHRVELKDEKILFMVSSEGEKVQLYNPIQFSSTEKVIENWFDAIETEMKNSLKCAINDAIVDCKVPTSKLKAWKWPQQVNLCISSIIWTKETANAINSQNLLECHSKNCAYLSELISVIEEPINDPQRLTLRALIILNINARDIIEELIENKVTDTNDFKWTSELRYYLEENGSRNLEVKIRMVNFSLKYGYEYLGNYDRLVITPLTVRCYRVLLTALHFNLGGAPEGPAGTGKTETCKDLAKAAAKQCIVFNCSEGLDLKAIGKIFKGIAMTGAWVCFDEFNRVEVEVLTVVAQQILTIQNAIASQKSTINFEGTEINFDKSCAIFITLNPDYLGRHQLPDNIKTLFRTVTMIVPDYELIAQISLYSMGFKDAKSLSEKIALVYNSCREQLSAQSHYDFGMRSIKSLLLAAAHIKNKYQLENEEPIILKALYQLNLPKLLPQDAILFDGIIRDLFDGISLSKMKEDFNFMDALLKSFGNLKLKAVPWLIEKVTQIYEILQINHGMMIVGEPFSGKTTIYKLLAETLDILIENDEKIEMNIIYPKALSHQHLFGYFDPSSNEWTDGIVAILFRKIKSCKSKNRKWVIFDGPIDPNWIENLNTVLDDSKRLCLMNGEIIKLPDKLTIFFETCDLTYASPATISRCGIIYIQRNKEFWKSIANNFLSNLEKNPSIDINQLQTINEVFFDFVTISINFYEKNNQHILKTSTIHQVHSLTRIYENMIKEYLTSELNPIQKFELLISLLIFALAWTFGAILKEPERLKFSTILNEELERFALSSYAEKFSTNSKFQLPRGSSVYDYYFDNASKSWKRWFDYPPRNIDNSSMDFPMKADFVPNAEYFQQIYFLKMHIENSIPLLFVGPTGSGKTSTVNRFLMGLSSQKYMSNYIPFDVKMTSSKFYSAMISKLDKRRKGLFGPPFNKQCVVFVDDLHCSDIDQFGVQSSIELFRQVIEHGSCIDATNIQKITVSDVAFVASQQINHNSRNLCHRLSRHFSVIGVDEHNSSKMEFIFNTILNKNLCNCQPSFQTLVKRSVSATLELYKTVKKTFLATPLTEFYRLNFRDISKAIDGLKSLPNEILDDRIMFLKIWVNEVSCEFSNRLTSEIEIMKFYSILKTIVKDTFVEEHRLFDENWFDICSSLYYLENLISVENEEVNQQITPYQSFKSLLIRNISEYNANNDIKIDISIFKDVVQNFIKVFRVLNRKNGHILLLGVGGTGRKSIVKLVSFMKNYQVYEVNARQRDSYLDWKDDIKKILIKCGIESQSITLFAKASVIGDDIMVDIDSLVRNGFIYDFFSKEELLDILEKLQQSSKNMIDEKVQNYEILFSQFTDQVRQNLHIVIVFNNQESDRNRLRSYSNLINWCHIIWFQDWSEEGLKSIATASMEPIIEDQETLKKIVNMCHFIHENMKRFTDIFVTKIVNPVIPRNYIELLSTFVTILKDKRKEIFNYSRKYELGIEKLNYAAGQVSIMKSDLAVLCPQLVSTSANTENLMIKIEQDTIEVEHRREIVGADELMANDKAAVAQKIRDECEDDLSDAVPALEKAIEALDTLKQSDITVLKSMKNPPSGVKLVMEAICIMKNIKPIRRPLASTVGKFVNDYWPAALKMIGDLKFLDSLKKFNRENIPPNIMKVIREKYTSNPDFDPVVIKSASNACEGMCRWVKAIDVFDRVSKVVGPKKQKLEEAEMELEILMKELNKKRHRLQVIIDKLQGLNDEFASMTRKKKELEDNIKTCSEKLERAKKLINGLQGENDRWSTILGSLKADYKNVVGNAFLSSAFIVYLAPYSSNIRERCVEDWKIEFHNNNLDFSEDFSIIKTLCKPSQCEIWDLQGLPSEIYFHENAAIVSYSSRWPLFIDPNGQATNWIKNSKSSNLRVLDQRHNLFFNLLENSIQYGESVLIEDVDSYLDPLLEPLITKQIFIHRGTKMMRLKENVIEFNENFELFFTSRSCFEVNGLSFMQNVCILDFSITRISLEKQLLAVIISKENIDLEDKKISIDKECAENNELLRKIEDKILDVIYTAQENILDNETAVEILSSSKNLSDEILRKQEIGLQAKMEIEKSRNIFKDVATFGTNIFFCITSLKNIDSMYSFSFDWFIDLFYDAIDKSQKTLNTYSRSAIIMDYFTESIYEFVSMNLNPKHQLIFSFMLALSVLKSRSNVCEESICYIMNENRKTNKNLLNLPFPHCLSRETWQNILKLSSSVESLSRLPEHIVNNQSLWKSFCEDLFSCHWPTPWNFKDDLDKILILRYLKPNKVISAIQELIKTSLGENFLSKPSLSLKRIFNFSNHTTPIIFFKSNGSSPIMEIVKFAESKVLSKAPIILTIHQQQEEKMIEQFICASKSGRWILLENCQLSPKFMDKLDDLHYKMVSKKEVHKDFRLWCISNPYSDFPSALLQKGLKISTQNSKTMKSSLLDCFLCASSDGRVKEMCDQSPLFCKLVLGLNLFHVVVQERSNYGPIGWTTAYDFNNCDLRISIMHLMEHFLLNCKKMPTSVIYNFIGECNYGGKISNEIDKSLLLSLLKSFTIDFVNDSLSSTFGEYIDENLPLNYENCIRLIKSLPKQMNVKILGFHENITINKFCHEAELIFDQIEKTSYVSLKRVKINSSVKTRTGIELCNELLEKIPQEFDLKAINDRFSIQFEESLNAIVQQETRCYNNLIIEIQSTIKTLRDVFNGQEVMTSELQECFNDLLLGNVPVQWRTRHNLSSKCLSLFLQKLIERFQFFDKWIRYGIPKYYDMTCFFNPRSVLAGLRQNYARANRTPVDKVVLRYKVIEKVSKLSEFEIVIQNLYLEGCRWDYANNYLIDPLPDKLVQHIPKILVQPVMSKAINSSSTYSYNCPLYRTKSRHSSSEQTTNLIAMVGIPSLKRPEHYLRRGAAAFLISIE